MRPVLVVDCYVEGDGAANYRRLLGPSRVEAWRALHDPRPTNVMDYAGIMITGSAACVTAPEPWMDAIVDLVLDARAAGIPVLGICFGHQLVAHAIFGEGSVRKSLTPEIGWSDIEMLETDVLFEGLGEGFSTFLSHFDEVVARDKMTVLARSERCGVQAYRVQGARIWGVQFHSEMAQDEAAALAVIRIEGRPDLGFDVDATVAAAKDSTSIATRLMNNFLEAQ